MEYTLIATSTFGIESVTASELKELGYEDLKVENGKVSFQGDEMDIAISNVWLRTADRVLIKMGEFKAMTFEELYQGTLAIDWGSLIPQNGIMHVIGKSIKSTLFSVPDCQSIVKKAVVEAMKRKYKVDWFPEDGPIYRIEVALLKDIVTLTIDTSGSGLHKRGYREDAGIAPMKETLAAALVLISKWNPDYALADLFCGSGTIPIEAALIAKNIAPGINRPFASEGWPTMKEDNFFAQVKEGARKTINKKEFKIIASDKDGRVLATARKNAEKAGVSEYINFQRMPMEDFSTKIKYGALISNPPYGERIGEAKEVEELYKTLGKMYEKMDTWSYYVITAHPDFQKHFGRKSDKNRKLYNGRLLCYYYQYIRPLPKGIK